MIYSVAVLDLCDFESIGRKMPKGQGVDASVYDGTMAPKHKSKKRSKSSTSTETVAKSQKCIVTAIEKADVNVKLLCGSCWIAAPLLVTLIFVCCGSC